MKDHYIVTVKDLVSGQVSTEGRFCKIHEDVQVRYYCETEERQVCVDCVSLYTCPSGHKRMTLKEAAAKQVSNIEELRKKCTANKKKFEDAFQKTVSTTSDLSDSVDKAKTELIKCKQQYIQQVEQVFDKQIHEIDKIQKERGSVLENKKKTFQSEISKLEKADNQAMHLTTCKSDYMITHKYPATAKSLNQLNLEKLKVDDKPLGYLGYLRYESIPMSVPCPGYVIQGEKWKLTDQFFIKELEKPKGIAINQYGDLTITSYDKGVKVFSRTGQVKGLFMEDCRTSDVAITHDNRYVVANKKCIQFHTENGMFLSNVPVSDGRDNESNLTSVAVDANDQIIAGHEGNDISIHYADGSLISKFATKSSPFCLDATSEGEIVCSYRDYSHIKCLELMDYSGSNIRTIQPPPEVKEWIPSYVCCREGEIFVVNGCKTAGIFVFSDHNGDPEGIFRYTAKGQYLGCVTTEVKCPVRIALSKDGMELFVVDDDGRGGKVKIFQRA